MNKKEKIIFIIYYIFIKLFFNLLKLIKINI